MAGYSDTRQMIIDTLMGRPAGTEIQPEDHQAFALQITDYVRSVELVAGNATPIGFADALTVPVQPDNGQALYLSQVGRGTTVVFTNFIDQSGNAISVTSDSSSVTLVNLLWNGQYWTKQETRISLENTIQENDIADGAVTTPKIANKAVTSEKLADGAVTVNKIADRSILGSKIVSNTITADKLDPDWRKNLAHKAVVYNFNVNNPADVPQLVQAYKADANQSVFLVYRSGIYHPAVLITQQDNEAIIFYQTEGVNLKKVIVRATGVKEVTIWGDTVRYSKQILTDAQKTQARNNIDAGTKAYIIELTQSSFEIEAIIEAFQNDENKGQLYVKTSTDILPANYDYIRGIVTTITTTVPVITGFKEPLRIDIIRYSYSIYSHEWNTFNFPKIYRNAVSYELQAPTKTEQKQARQNLALPDYVTFDSARQLTSAIGKYVKYFSESDTIVDEEDGVINIDSNILEIDFCGATLETKEGIKGHARCKIKNLTIKVLSGQHANGTAIEGFGYVENVYVTTEKDGTHKIGYGFKNCDHLFNCKVDGITEDEVDGAATGFYYCNYLFQCRYSGWPTMKYCYGFNYCKFISQCYMKYGYAISNFKYSLENNRYVESLIGITMNGDIPVFETFADTSHIRIGDYNMDNFIKLISSDGGTGKTKLYAKPDDKSGIATVLLDTTPVNWAVARRTATGTLKAKDAVEEDDTVTKKQLDAVKAKITTVLQEVTIYTDNTEEHKQANIDNLHAYKVNLKALGVDTLSGFQIPITMDDGYMTGSLYYAGDNYLEFYNGIFFVQDTTEAYRISIKPDGSYEESMFALNEDIEQVKTLANAVKAFGAIELKASDDAANKTAITAYLKILTDAGVSTANGYSVPVRITGNSQEYHGMLNIGTGVLLSGVVTDVNENHHYPFNVSTTDGVITFDESNYFLEKTSNEVTEMLDAIKYSHTSVPFTDTTLSNKAQLEVFLSKVPDATVMHCTYKEIWAGTLHKINGDWYGLLVKNTNSPADNINIKLSADGTVITSNSAQ